MPGWALMPSVLHTNSWSWFQLLTPITYTKIHNRHFETTPDSKHRLCSYGIINKIQTTPTRRKRNNSFAINQRETSGIIALTVCGCQVRGFSRDSGFNHSRPRDIFLSGYSPLLFIYKNYNRKILRLRCNIYRVFTLCCCCYKLCFLGAWGSSLHRCWRTFVFKYTKVLMKRQIRTAL